MNKKNSNDKKDQRKAECGDVGRSSKKNNKLPKRSKYKEALTIRDSGVLSGDEDFIDFVDDSLNHPTHRPKPHKRDWDDSNDT